VSGDAERELLKDALLTIRALKADLKARDAARRGPIAIIGIGCRFPGGANTADAFWQLKDQELKPHVLPRIGVS
jgi:hypothetical protein